jgi:peptide/nickel transport system permease protein
LNANLFFLHEIKNSLCKESPFNRIRRNPGRSIGLAIIVVMVMIASLAPYLAPYDPDERGWTPFLSPNSENKLGTDDMGKDIFSQLIFASRISLAVGFAAATVAITIGVAVGLVAGYFRGWVEDLLLGITDLFLLIPGLPLMIILSSYMGPSVMNVIVIISLLWWCSTARVVHSRVLQVREMSYIESAKAMGFSGWYIMFRHILRNTKDVIVAKWSLAIASAMITEAGLAFLGLGDPYQVSWGGMISNAFNRGGYALDLWWWYAVPGAMICLTASAFFMITMRGRKIAYQLEMI